MNYDMIELLKLPHKEQEEIANTVYKHLSSSHEEDKEMEEEVDKRFAEIESAIIKGILLKKSKISCLLQATDLQNNTDQPI